MNILITGGAGYIGCVLVDELYKAYDQQINITVLDNLLHKQICLLSHFNKPNFNFIVGDVRDKELMKQLVNNHDIIIPLAAYVGAPMCDKLKEETIAVNQTSIEELSTFLARGHRVIFPTTNSGYGISDMWLPPIDGELAMCSERTPLNPISLYGKTKCEAESILLNSNAVTLRLATVFGLSDRMRLDLLVNDFTYKAYIDKYIVLFESHFKRNFVHIKDVCNAIIFSIDNYEKMANQPYNVGLSSANLSKMELCECIKKFVPDFYITESDINKDPDKRNYIISNDKLESLGWSCNHTLDDGIMELLRGYRMLAHNKQYCNA